jgi:hypothetical protein
MFLLIEGISAQSLFLRAFSLPHISAYQLRGDYLRQLAGYRPYRLIPSIHLQYFLLYILFYKRHTIIYQTISSHNSIRLAFSAMSQRPVLLLMHGGGHAHPKYLEALQNTLQAQGFSTVSGANPSDGATNFTPGQSFYDDAAYWREKILSIIDNEQDVVLFMHSVAAALGIEAAKGLTKADRGKVGKKGGVAHLIFLAGYLPNEGDHVFAFYDGSRAKCPTRAEFVKVSNRIERQQYSSLAAQARIVLC